MQDNSIIIPAKEFKRQHILSFDLARGLAILFMIMQHVVIMYGTPETANEGFGLLIILLGTVPAAPVFMFLMGVFFTYTRKEDYQIGLQRGLRLLLLGYCLNFFRLAFPAFIGLELGLITEGDIEPDTPASYFLIVDILQFAGLSMIIMALMRRFFRNRFAYGLLAAIVLAISPFLWGSTTGYAIADEFLRLLWGTDDNVAFPLFPWLSYPLVGMIFGSYLKEGNDIDKLVRSSKKSGLVLLLLGSFISLTNLEYHFGDYYRSGPGSVILYIGFVLLWLALCHRLVEVIPENPVYNILFYWSKNVTAVYFIQWVIISWGIIIIGYQTQRLPAILVLIAIMIVSTQVITHLYLEANLKKTRAFR